MGTIPAYYCSMAAVDSLLRLISARNADALTIIANGIPELHKAGAQIPLSMPPLSSTIVEGFIAEVGGRESTYYSASDGSHYSMHSDGVSELLRMTFTLLGTPSNKDHEKGSSLETTQVLSPNPFSGTVSGHVATTPLKGELADLLANARERGASDILLSSDNNSWIRVNGRMQSLSASALSADKILSSLGKSKEELEKAHSLDFSFDCDGRYRVNLFRQDRGIAAALRPIRSSAPSISGLNLPSSLVDLVNFSSGLVLVAGSAGSGKSTTINALIEHVNRSASQHVITLEDPIEYRYQSHNSLIHQRELGTHVPSFASGLRAALRESPDIIVVGEMRDYETIAAAITAAETGHLIFGTIHASDAVVAIDRIIDVFPAAQQQQVRYQLSIILQATLTQHLVPTPDLNGRVPAIELMLKNDAVAASIRSGKTHSILSSIQTGRDKGMISLELSLARFVRDGRISRKAAMRAARSPDTLALLLN